MLRKIFSYSVFVILLAACSPICSDTELVPANHLSPGVGTTVTSPRPTFSWNFEPAVDCVPYMYTVFAGTSPFLDTTRPSEIFYAESSEGELSSTPYWDAFANCTLYYWHVRTTGPTVDLYSHLSMFKTDFSDTCTWPAECSSGAKPPAPDPILPYGGETVNTLNPDLAWQPGEPACEPGDYYFEVSTSPEFVDDVIEGYTNDTIHSEPSPYLENCHTYYWRVTARNIPSTTHSMIKQFWTDTGGCTTADVCTADQIVADTLIYPVGGEVVANPAPYLVWKSNLPGCLAAESRFIVSEVPDFSTHVIGGGGTPETADFPDSTIFNTGMEIYHDCTAYYWKTSESAGETTVWSDVATFVTDFGSACGITASPMADIIDRIRFDCINPNLTVIIFDFNSLVQGEFAAQVDNQTWNCEFQANNHQMLICTGPYVRENVSKQVVLMDLTTQKAVFTKDVVTPICELPTPNPKPPSCHEPAIPCIQFGCVWNQSACRCEKNGGACTGQ